MINFRKPAVLIVMLGLLLGSAALFYFQRQEMPAWKWNVESHRLPAGQLEFGSAAVDGKIYLIGGTRPAPLIALIDLTPNMEYCKHLQIFRLRFTTLPSPLLGKLFILPGGSVLRPVTINGNLKKKSECSRLMREPGFCARLPHYRNRNPLSNLSRITGISTRLAARTGILEA